MTQSGEGEGFPEILREAKANEPWAFECLYTALARPVLGYLRSQGAPDPEDLLGDVFLGVFRGLQAFEGGEAAFRSWVFTIAHHRLVDERRRIGRRTVPTELDRLDDALAPTEGAETDALGRLGEERVRGLLNRLAPDQRDVLLLRIIGDLTLSQTADVLGKSLVAVKALQRRGLTALRRSLAAEGVPL